MVWGDQRPSDVTSEAVEAVRGRSGLRPKLALLSARRAFFKVSIFNTVLARSPGLPGGWVSPWLAVFRGVS